MLSTTSTKANGVGGYTSLLRFFVPSSFLSFPSFPSFPECLEVDGDLPKRSTHVVAKASWLVLLLLLVSERVVISHRVGGLGSGSGIWVREKETLYEPKGAGQL